MWARSRLLEYTVVTLYKQARPNFGLEIWEKDMFLPELSPQESIKAFLSVKGTSLSFFFICGVGITQIKSEADIGSCSNSFSATTNW